MATSTVQDVVSDAKKLANRLKKYDATTDSLLAKAQTLEKTVDSMKEYHDELNQLSRVHPQIPRSNLIVAIQRESKQMQALERENRDLRITLNDYANALELIMSKYRQQVSQLIQSNHHHHHSHHHHHHKNRGSSSNNNSRNNRQEGQRHDQQPAAGTAGAVRHESQETVKRLQVHESPNTSSSSSSSVQSLDCYQRQPDLMLMNRHRDKIMEMAAVMMKAVDLDEKDSTREHEMLVQLKTENEGLRQLLAITRQNGNLAQATGSRKAVAVPNDDAGDADAAGGTATMIPKKKTTKSIAIQTHGSDS